MMKCCDVLIFVIHIALKSAKYYGTAVSQSQYGTLVHYKTMVNMYSVYHGVCMYASTCSYMHIQSG